MKDYQEKILFLIALTSIFIIVVFILQNLLFEYLSEKVVPCAIGINEDHSQFWTCLNRSDFEKYPAPSGIPTKYIDAPRFN